ncbi:hypothetical protein CF326_g6346 [Tilletia indica]|nr:hypothetical protein CF326_g6346 [Tilletia indica]
MSDPTSYRRQCDDCDKVFDKKSSYDHHYQTVHRPSIAGLEVDGLGVVPPIYRTAVPDGPGAFMCPRPGCDWGSPNPRYLTDHVKTCTAVALPPSSMADSPAEAIDQAFDQLVKNVEAAAAEASRAYVPPPAPTMTAWLQHTCWPKLFEGQDLTAYAALASAISSGDDAEVTAANAYVRTQLKGMHDILVEEGSRPLRQLLNCADEAQAHVAKAAGVHPSSLPSYSAVFERAATFWIKVKNAAPSTTGIEVAQDILRTNSTFRFAVEHMAVCQDPAMVVQFGMALIKDPVTGIGKTHPLIVFLAAYGIEDGASSAFKTASIMGPVLSRLIFTLRLCFFMRTILRFGSRDALQKAEFFAFFEEEHKQHLGTASSLLTPIKHLIGLRAFARKLAKAEGGRALFHWSEDGQTLLFQGARVTLTSIREFLAEVVHRAERKFDILTEEASGSGWQPSPEMFAELVDDASNTQPTYWFGKHPKNALRVRGLGVRVRMRG